MAASRPLGPGIEHRPLLLQDGMRVGSEFIIRPRLLEATGLPLDAIRPVCVWRHIGEEGLRHLREEHSRHLREEEDLSDEEFEEEKDGEASDGQTGSDSQQYCGEQGDWNEQAWQDWLSNWNEQGDWNEQAWHRIGCQTGTSKDIGMNKLGRIGCQTGMSKAIGMSLGGKLGSGQWIRRTTSLQTHPCTCPTPKERSSARTTCPTPKETSSARMSSARTGFGAGSQKRD